MGKAHNGHRADEPPPAAHATTRGRGWVSLAEAARLFGRSKNSFARFVRPHIPPGALQPVGRGWLVHMPATIKAWAVHHYGQAGQPTHAEQKATLDLRERELRIERSALQLDKDRGSVVRAAEVEAVFSQLATALRGASGRLDAAGQAVLAETLCELERTWEASAAMKRRSDEATKG